MTGHDGWVRSVAWGQVEGRVVLASAGGDGTVRLWDAATGAARGEPLTGHDGWVWSVAWGQVEGQVVLASGDSRGRVEIRSMTGTSMVPGEERTDEPEETSREARTSRDDEETDDELGRDELAAHLVGVLGQLAAVRAGSDRASGSVVVSVDGRWGSGKSVLARLVAGRLSGERLSTESKVTADVLRLAEPIVVRFDAWRESNLGPEWWSLAAALNRAIRGERAWVTRLAMTLDGGVRRLVRSRAVVAAVLTAVALGVLARFLPSDGTAKGVQETVEVITKVLTGVTAFAALGLALGRALFWASPAVGRLYVKADDNPLQEISGIVGRLRRWSPRAGRSHRLADTALAVWCLLVVVQAWQAVLSTDASTRVGAAGQWGAALLPDTWLSLVVGVVVLAVVGAGLVPLRVAPAAAEAAHRAGSGSWWLRLSPQWVRSAVASIRSAIGRLRSGALPFRTRLVSSCHALVEACVRLLSRRWVRWVGPLVVAMGCGLLVARRPGAEFVAAWFPWPSLVLLAVGVAAYLGWRRAGLSAPRRPILLVLDDIDRCHEAQAVKYLETVHTLLRHRAPSRTDGPGDEPAPMLVLVLGDGRWVRAAFSRHYETFAALGDPTRMLGADFIQKLFDHTVLVPDLTADQARHYLAVVTRSPIGGSEEVSEPIGQGGKGVTPAQSAAAAGPIEPGTNGAPDAPDAPAASEDPELADPRSAGASGGPDPDPDDPMRERRDDLLRGGRRLDPEQARQAYAKEKSSRALRAASPEVTEERRRHLLITYPALMPASPRLIRRVVNTWGMLETVKSHVGHQHDDDTVIRAAVFFVRFPSLVDELIDTQTPVPIHDLRPPSHLSRVAAGTDSVTAEPTGGAAAVPSTATAAKPDPVADRLATWRRPDVLQVLQRRDGSFVEPRSIGECYGRRYPDLITPWPPAPESGVDATPPALG